MTQYAEIERMAAAIARSGLFPGLRTVEQAITLCLLAEADGQHPVAGARDYHIIQGRPALKADAMLARFQTAGGKVEWHEYSDQRVAARFSHPAGGTVDIDWTLERAAAAGLKSEMWKKYPRALMRARVCGEGIRAVCPGVLQGMYTPEEVADMVEPQYAATPPVIQEIPQTSQERLTAMKFDANLMTTVETLKAWWQTQAQARSLLTPEHLEELKQHCAAHKAAILKDSLYEDQRPEGNPPPSPNPAPGGQPGPQDTPQGAPPGTPPPPVSAPDAGEEPATDEQVAAVRRLAVDTGVTNERLAAWVKAASKDITEDPAALTMKALAAVQKKIEATIKPGKQVTVEGTIMPDGYAVDNQAHIFDTDALDRGEFIEA